MPGHVLTNADSIRIANELAQDSVLRQAVVAQAESYLRQTASADTATVNRAMQNLKEVKKIGLTIGWEDDDTTDWQWITKAIGLMLTALAASLGAPFWFDLLKRVVSIRSSGKAPPAQAPAEPATATPQK